MIHSIVTGCTPDSNNVKCALPVLCIFQLHTSTEINMPCLGACNMSEVIAISALWAGDSIESA